MSKRLDPLMIRCLKEIVYALEDRREAVQGYVSAVLDTRMASKTGRIRISPDRWVCAREHVLHGEFGRISRCDVLSLLQ